MPRVQQICRLVNTQAGVSSESLRVACQFGCSAINIVYGQAVKNERGSA